MEWDEQAFQARVDKRLAEIDKSRSGALIERGHDQDLLRQRNKLAPRVDTLLKIIDALDWTIEEAFGVPSNARVDTKMLCMAMRAMDEIIHANIEGDRPEILCNHVALLYDVMAERKEEGRPLKDFCEVLDYAYTAARAAGLRTRRKRR